MQHITEIDPEENKTPRETTKTSSQDLFTPTVKAALLPKSNNIQL